MSSGPVLYFYFSLLQLSKSTMSIRLSDFSDSVKLAAADSGTTGYARVGLQIHACVHSCLLYSSLRLTCQRSRRKKTLIPHLAIPR